MKGIKLILGLKAIEELVKKLEKTKRDIRRGNYNVVDILSLLVDCQLASFEIKMKKIKESKKKDTAVIYT